MHSRPPAVTFIAWVLIAAGAVGLAYHAGELRYSFRYEVALACAVRLLAIVAGVFMLRGRNWARWLALAWIAFHVVVSVFHSFDQVLMHSVVLLLFAWFLSRPRAAAYFRANRPEAA